MGAMKIDLEVWVEGSDEPQLVTVDQRDMAAFERFFKVGTSKAMEDMTMTFFRFTGWLALRRTGQTNIGFDDWEKNVISVEPPDDPDPEKTDGVSTVGVPDPTSPAA
jgi:hypothetical protein